MQKYKLIFILILGFADLIKVSANDDKFDKTCSLPGVFDGVDFTKAPQLLELFEKTFINSNNDEVVKIEMEYDTRIKNIQEDIENNFQSEERAINSYFDDRIANLYSILQTANADEEKFLLEISQLEQDRESKINDIIVSAQKIISEQSELIQKEKERVIQQAKLKQFKSDQSNDIIYQEEGYSLNITQAIYKILKMLADPKTIFHNNVYDINNPSEQQALQSSSDYLDKYNVNVSEQLIKEAQNNLAYSFIEGVALGNYFKNNSSDDYTLLIGFTSNFFTKILMQDLEIPFSDARLKTNGIEVYHEQEKQANFVTNAVKHFFSNVKFREKLWSIMIESRFLSTTNPKIANFQYDPLIIAKELLLKDDKIGTIVFGCGKKNQTSSHLIKNFGKENYVESKNFIQEQSHFVSPVHLLPICNMCENSHNNSITFSIDLADRPDVIADVTEEFVKELFNWLETEKKGKKFLILDGMGEVHMEKFKKMPCVKEWRKEY